jgi:hypothetical protein
MNGRAFTLRRQVRLGGAAARDLAGDVSSAPLAGPWSEGRMCGMFDGSAAVLAIAYPNRGDVDVWVTLGGCGGMSNGFIVAVSPQTPLPNLDKDGTET